MGLLRRSPARVVARRAVPWLLYVDLARAARDHWSGQLPPRDRSRLIELLKRSHGRPGALTGREQREARRLLKKLDLTAFAKHATKVAVVGNKRRGRRR